MVAGKMIYYSRYNDYIWIIIGNSWSIDCIFPAVYNGLEKRYMWTEMDWYLALSIETQLDLKQFDTQVQLNNLID